MATELEVFPTWTAGRNGYIERIHQLFREHLEAKGLRFTHPRDAILDYLLKAERHVSFQDIYKALKPLRVGRVTVFRTLKLLEEARLAERVTDVSGTDRYEIRMERPHHDHLICVDCGAIREIQWPDVEKAQEKACRAVGFIPLRHRHEVHGRCAACQAKRA